MQDNELREGYPVFGVLPLEVWDQNIWPLVDVSSRGAVKASCKAGSWLADQLIESVRITTATNETMADNLNRSRSSIQPRRTGTTVTSAAAAFARRLPRLQALSIIVNSPSLDPWLSGPLALGPPLPGVRSLKLQHLGPSTIQPSDMRPLLKNLPGLRHVDLTLPLLPSSLGSDLACYCQVLEALILCQLGHNYSGPCGPPDALERTLQPLSQLDNLSALTIDTNGVYIPVLGHPRLQAAAGITSLRSLCWQAEWDWEPASELSTLTRLTSVELHQRPGPVLFPTQDQVAASVGSLPLLECLHLPDVVVDWALWHGALARLPCLRVLQASGLDLQPTGGGGPAGVPAAAAGPRSPAPLPSLQRLHLVPAQSEQSGTHLLAGLLAAVRAMPALAEFTADRLRLIPTDGAHFGRMWRGLLALDEELLRLRAEAVRVDVEANLSRVRSAPMLEIVRMVEAMDVHTWLGLQQPVPQQRAVHCTLGRIGQQRLELSSLPDGVLGAEEMLWTFFCTVAESARVVCLSSMNLGTHGGDPDRWMRGLANGRKRERVTLCACAGLGVESISRLATELHRGARMWADLDMAQRRRHMLGDGEGGAPTAASHGEGGGTSKSVVLEVVRCEGVCTQEGVAEVSRLWDAEQHPMVQLKIVV